MVYHWADVKEEQGRYLQTLWSEFQDGLLSKSWQEAECITC